MFLKSIDNRIRRAFSDAAMQYDVLASLHKEIGRELIKKVVAHEPCERILDVGMGTGWLTGRISYFFPESIVVGVDLAEGMIETAKKNIEYARLVQGNAKQLPFKNESFDIVLSNLAYQWVDDLPNAFRLTHAALRNQGRFTFTMFGHHTCDELFVSLDHALKQENKNLVVKRLANKKKVAEALESAGFKDIKTDYERIKVHFPDVMSLLKWLKTIGANNLERDGFVGRDLITSMETYYEEHFQDHLGIVTTFEVIWADARK